MWKYRHTARLILVLLASPCFGQWSEIWTNGDLFAVEQMASQCYSASVERCEAKGITPNTPSWWDYLLGKNHAKLLSVKSNIKACRPYYIMPTNDYPGIVTNSGIESLFFTNDASFTIFCGLSGSALDDTPWFQTQFKATTGGWWDTYIMLTNLVVAATAFFDARPASNNFSLTWSGVSSNGYDDAYSEAASSDPTTNDATGTPISLITAQPMSSPYVSLSITKAFPEWVSPSFEGTVTNFSANCYFFYRAGYRVGDNSTIMRFDPQGDNVSTNYLFATNWTRAVSETTGPKFYGFWNTPISHPPPNYYAVTNYPNQNPRRQGWVLRANNLTIHDFRATTNGFRYK